MECPTCCGAGVVMHTKEDYDRCPVCNGTGWFDAPPPKDEDAKEKLDEMFKRDRENAMCR